MFRAFDQRYKVANDSKYLELTEDEDEDSGYNVIFRRLLYAASDEQLRGNLDLEDYVERMITIQEAEKEDLEYELKETKTQLAASIKMLLSLGVSPDQIAVQLNIPISQVETVIKGLTL